MMDVVVIIGVIRLAKLQSNCHHQQTNTQLFTGWMPLMTPNQQCQSTEGNRLFSNTGLKCVSVFDDVV